MRPADLAKRCSALRLPQSELAALAGLDENTIGRAFKPEANPLMSTLRAMEAAIAAEERRLRDHLLTLHPIQSEPPRAA